MKGSRLIVLILAGCGLMSMLASTVEAAPGYEFGVNNQRDFRSRRGFKTSGLATARGFGKRTVLPPFSSAPASSASQSYTYDVNEQHQQPSPLDDHPGNEELETYAILDTVHSFITRQRLDILCCHGFIPF